jgi:hypothetical protein
MTIRTRLSGLGVGAAARAAAIGGVGLYSDDGVAATAPKAQGPASNGNGNGRSPSRSVRRVKTFA